MLRVHTLAYKCGSIRRSQKSDAVSLCFFFWFSLKGNVNIYLFLHSFCFGEIKKEKERESEQEISGFVLYSVDSFQYNDSNRLSEKQAKLMQCHMCRRFICIALVRRLSLNGLVRYICSVFTGTHVCIRDDSFASLSPQCECERECEYENVYPYSVACLPACFACLLESLEEALWLIWKNVCIA